MNIRVSFFETYSHTHTHTHTEREREREKDEDEQHRRQKLHTTLIPHIYLEENNPRTTTDTHVRDDERKDTGYKRTKSKTLITRKVTRMCKCAPRCELRARRHLPDPARRLLP